MSCESVLEHVGSWGLRMKRKRQTKCHGSALCKHILFHRVHKKRGSCMTKYRTYCEVATAVSWCNGFVVLLNGFLLVAWGIEDWAACTVYFNLWWITAWKLWHELDYWLVSAEMFGTIGTFLDTSVKLEAWWPHETSIMDKDRHKSSLNKQLVTFTNCTKL